MTSNVIRGSEWKEQAINFECAEKQLMANLHLSDDLLEVGVLIIVGGPQYRVGSHRQFLQLSRYLSTAGIASMRFDYRGMGDSEGEKQSFEDIESDIKAAVDAFIQHSGVKKVVLWGLCDGASAALMYAATDPRIEGLVLLNPWLQSDAAKGKTMLRHYYLKRLLSVDFWRKLFAGRVKVSAGINEAKGFVKDSVSEQTQDLGSYQSRMAAGLKRFEGYICLILSGVDLTAREFEQVALQDKSWKGFASAKCEIHRIPAADHTFSSKAFKSEVELLTATFIKKLVE